MIADKDNDRFADCSFQLRIDILYKENNHSMQLVSPINCESTRGTCEEHWFNDDMHLARGVGELTRVFVNTKQI